jgi:uncharacterized protein
MERRQEMMEEIPAGMTEVRLLLVQVRRPEPQAGLGPALHPGALSFYDKDKPSFLLAHADYVGLFITVGLMAGSWLWELKRWMQRKQKSKADQYSNRVVALISSVQEVNSLQPLDEAWRELLKILTEAVHDLDADKLSEESFNSFRTILQIGMEVTKERRSILMSTSAATWTASAAPYRNFLRKKRLRPIEECAARRQELRSCTKSAPPCGDTLRCFSSRCPSFLTIFPWLGRHGCSYPA